MSDRRPERALQVLLPIIWFALVKWINCSFSLINTNGIEFKRFDVYNVMQMASSADAKTLQSISS